MCTRKNKKSPGSDLLHRNSHKSIECNSRVDLPWTWRTTSGNSNPPLPPGVSLHIHIYIYICTCTHTHIYTYTYIYIYIYTCIHTHVYIYVYIYIYKHLSKDLTDLGDDDDDDENNDDDDDEAGVSRVSLKTKQHRKDRIETNCDRNKHNYLKSRLNMLPEDCLLVINYPPSNKIKNKKHTKKPSRCDPGHPKSVRIRCEDAQAEGEAGEHSGRDGPDDGRACDPHQRAGD